MEDNDKEETVNAFTNGVGFIFTNLVWIGLCYGGALPVEWCWKTIGAWIIISLFITICIVPLSISKDCSPSVRLELYIMLFFNFYFKIQAFWFFCGWWFYDFIL